MPAPRKKQSGVDRIREDADKGSVPPTKDADRRQPPTNADKELVRLTARVARWQRSALEARAEAEGRLLSELVREAVREYLRRG